VAGRTGHARAVPSAGASHRLAAGTAACPEPAAGADSAGHRDRAFSQPHTATTRRRNRTADARHYPATAAAAGTCAGAAASATQCVAYGGGTWPGGAE
jgi:hypothetical protein